MVTLYYYFGLLFFLLTFFYVFAYKEIGHKIDIIKLEHEKTGYMSNEYKLYLAVGSFKILFFSYAIIGLFSSYTLYFFAIMILMSIIQIKWHYQIKKIIYFLILVILFIILYDYFK